MTTASKPLISSWRVLLDTVVCEGCYEAVESFVHRRIRFFSDSESFAI